MPTILSVLGAVSALLLYNKYPEFILSLTENKIGRNIYTLLNNKYYFDILYNNYIIVNGYKLGYKISKEIDRGVIELLGPHGISNTIINFGKNLSKFDTGIITTYALYFTLGLIFLLSIVFSTLIFDMSINDLFRIIIILVISLFILE